MWVSLLHVTGEHSWALGSCHHGPLVEPREKDWIEPNSEAHQKLCDLILDARGLEDVPKYLHFRSTADLESFHNHILMYTSKRFCFTHAVYSSRVFLAALDYNHHINRAPREKKRWHFSICKTLQQTVPEMVPVLHKGQERLQLHQRATSRYCT